MALLVDAAPVAFTAIGAFTYTIPADANTIDVVLINGGSRGQNGGASNGANGGPAGAWIGITLVRGVDIPLATTTITGTVGAGGNQSTAAQNTSAAATGWAGLTASGTVVNVGRNGQTPGDFVFDGQTYIGGAQASPGVAGNAPGGGGGAGNPGNGASGARGAAFIFGYNTVPKGAGAGTYGWLGHAVGHAGTPSAHGAGSYGWTAAPHGQRTPVGHKVSSYGWTASPRGDMKAHGLGVGGYGWAGTGRGAKLPKGHGAGTYQWSGVGRSGFGGRGEGAYGWLGAAIGRMLPRASGAGGYGWVYAHVAGIALHRLTIVPTVDRAVAVPAPPTRHSAVLETSRVAVVSAAPRRATVKLSVNRTTIVPVK